MKLGIYNYVVGSTTHANPCGALATWVGGLGTQVTCHQFGFLVYHFLFFCFIRRLMLSPHQWSHFDDLYVMRRVFAQEYLLGVLLID